MSMGIFAKIKKLFSKDIEVDASKLVGLVNPYQPKGKKVTLNTNVKVPQNYVFAIGAFGKTLDTFNEGDYILSAATLPHCCKRFKLHKQNKKGDFKKSFNAEIYFLNLNEYEFDLKTNGRAELGGRTRGIFTVGARCSLKIKIRDARKFLNMLLDEYAFLRQGEGEKILKMHVSELILHILFKFNFAISEFLANNPLIENNLKNELSKKLDKFGITLLELKNVSFDIPQKYINRYKKAQEVIKQQEIENQVGNQLAGILDEELEVDEEPKLEEQAEEIKSIFAEEQIEETEGNVIETKIQELETLKQEEIIEQSQNEGEELKEEENIGYVPFGNMVIEEKQEDWVNETKETKIDDVETSKGGEFVDLNLDNLYARNAEGVKCEYCGYVNDKDLSCCEVCGTKLKGEDDGQNN